MTNSFILGVSQTMYYMKLWNHCNHTGLDLIDLDLRGGLVIPDQNNS